jgi:hypothetical protein
LAFFSPKRQLRTHQAQLAAIVQAIAAGEAGDVHDILAAGTPGGGKPLLPVIPRWSAPGS